MTKRQTTNDDKQEYKALRTVLQENITRAECDHHRMIKRISGDLEQAVRSLTRDTNGLVAELSLAIRSRELLERFKVGGIDMAREYIDELRRWRERWLPESSTNPYHNLGGLEEYRGIASLIETFDRHVRRAEQDTSPRKPSSNGARVAPAQ